MAKRRAASKSKLDSTAETLGRMLGRVAAQFHDWQQQRGELASQLTRIVDRAQEMLGDLKQSAERGAKAARRAAGASGGRKRRTVSAAARRKMSIAAKKRWAARKAGTRKTAPSS